MTKEEATDSIDHEIDLLQSRRTRLTERLDSCQRLGYQAEAVNITTNIDLLSSFIVCLKRVKSYVKQIDDQQEQPPTQ